MISFVDGAAHALILAGRRMISPSLSGLRMLASQGARVRFERDELPTLHEWF
jgi:hypothetical protein